MKICLVVDKVPKYKIGGAEQQFFLIGKELASRGYNVHMTCRRFDADQPDTEEIEGVTVHSYGRPPGEGNRVANHLQTQVDFLATLYAADCDVYHNTPASPLTGLSRLYSQIRGRPFLFTLAHENDYTHEHWRDRSTWRRHLYQYGLRNADRRIVLADYMKEGLSREYGLDSRTIRYGYPIPDDVAIEDKERRVVWIARIVDWKQPERFVELAERVDADDWTFHLIGTCEDEDYFNAVAERCRDIESLVFEGPVDPGEDMEWYKRAGLFVNTSTAEGFPNSYIQSWVCGTPVAALNVDPDGLIADHDAGVSPTTFDSLVERVEALLTDDERRREVSHNASELGAQFDIRRTADEYLRTYEEVLATPR